jgi:hypothetical protein
MKSKKTKKAVKQLFTDDLHDMAFRLYRERIRAEEDIWEKLNNDLAYWKNQLRLDGVEIELRWLTYDEVASDSRVGQWENMSRAHLFRIGIAPYNLRPLECSDLFNCDYEVTLVHELLHIVNSAWMDKGGIPQAMENDVLAELENDANDTVAEALVRARRGIKR